VPIYSTSSRQEMFLASMSELIVISVVEVCFEMDQKNGLHC